MFVCVSVRVVVVPVEVFINRLQISMNTKLLIFCFNTAQKLDKVAQVS